MLSADSLVSISALETMVATFPNPAHIKCPKTGVYFYSNSLNSKLYGMDGPDDLEGLTVIDLMEHTGKEKLTNEYVKNVGLLDKEVAKVRDIKIDRSKYIMTHEGFLRFQDMYKTPIKGNNDRIIAILTYSIERTHEVDLLVLFSIYLKKYVNKKLATARMLKHIGLGKYFCTDPSYAELYTLLAVGYYGEDRKYVGHNLGVSFKTVQKHIEAIKDKLHNEVCFKAVLHHIRTPKL